MALEGYTSSNNVIYFRKYRVVVDRQNIDGLGWSGKLPTAARRFDKSQQNTMPK